MANLVTFVRVSLGLFILFILKIDWFWNLLAIFLIILVMTLDALDGAIARHLKTSTKIGSIYDILADRIIENIFFVYFAYNQVFGLGFTLIILVRGLVIDALRAISALEGKTAFGATTMHRSTWSIFLACSKTSRGLYNSCKMLTFIFYAALLENHNVLYRFIDPTLVTQLASIFLWLTILLSVLRAIPVCWDSFKLKYKENIQAEKI